MARYKINPKSGAKEFTVQAKNIQQAVAKGKAKRQKGRLKTGKSFTVRRL